MEDDKTLHCKMAGRGGVARKQWQMTGKESVTMGQWQMTGNDGVARNTGRWPGSTEGNNGRWLDMTEWQVGRVTVTDLFKIV